MGDNDLENRFPDMRPVRKPPALSTVNGIGCCVYGGRDFDAESGTYVKTHAFCILFIPIVFLGAYRVADAPSGGWYFLGRVPLSALARAWNYFLLSGILCLAGLIAWISYTTSRDYLAAKRLAEGDRLAEAGQVVPAAQAYQEVALGLTRHSPAARQKLEDLLDAPAVRASAANATAVVVKVVSLNRTGPPAVPLLGRGLKLVEHFAQSDPRGALTVADALAPLLANKNPALVKKEADALAAVQLKLLERVVQKEPANVEMASRLAVLYEQKKDLARCEKLLAPHEKRLGLTEGARVLGQIYARQGKFEQAYALLQPYAEERLKKFHAVEKDFEETIKRFDERLVQRIRTNQAPDFPAAEFKRAANDEQRQAIYQKYFFAKLKDDPEYQAALEARQQTAGVTSVALDLGTVMLRRAQAMNDPAARRRELERAEKVFLAVRSAAGQTDQYRLYLGQVYYWLGKHAEGRKQFDELLAARKRAAVLLVRISEVLREVGSESEARSLAEEAYEKAGDDKTKHTAASQRALLAKDLDDRILWLGRSDLRDLSTKADLQSTKGHQAARDGKEEEAARHYREAIATYGQLPQNEAILNNSALVHFALYRVTGERRVLDQGTEMLEKALALRPGDSILLLNAADSLEKASLRDIIGAALDLNALKTDGDLELFPFLYCDEAGRNAYRDRVRKHAGIVKATAYYDRLMVLAPKRVRGYSRLLALHGLTEDLPALQNLLKRLEAVELDQADANRLALEYYQGKNDAKLRKDLQPMITRYERAAEATRKGDRKTTFAAAAASLANWLPRLEQLGAEVDANRVVALAEEAYQAAPSEGTNNALFNALLFRAGRALIAQEPAYAALAKRAKRALGHSYLIPVALAQEGELRAKVLANPDVRRALTLIRDNLKVFPSAASEWAWAMLREAHPEEAAKVAEAVRKNEAGRVKRSIQAKLSPLSATDAFMAYWALQIAGQEADGIKVLKAYAARGVPMPFDLK